MPSIPCKVNHKGCQTTFPYLQKKFLNKGLQAESETIGMAWDSNKECCGGPLG